MLLSCRASRIGLPEGTKALIVPAAKPRGKPACTEIQVGKGGKQGMPGGKISRPVCQELTEIHQSLQHLILRPDRLRVGLVGALGSDHVYQLLGQVNV